MDGLPSGASCLSLLIVTVKAISFLSICRRSSLVINQRAGIDRMLSPFFPRVRVQDAAREGE